MPYAIVTTEVKSVNMCVKISGDIKYGDLLTVFKKKSNQLSSIQPVQQGFVATGKLCFLDGFLIYPCLLFCDWLVSFLPVCFIDCFEASKKELL